MSVEQVRPGLPSWLAQSHTHTPTQRWVVELLAFAWHHAWACVFPVFIFVCLTATHFITIPFLPRYDLLLALCLGFQVLLYRSGWESADEVKVIAVFHALGLILELFKVHIGSWSYPDFAWTKVGGVPLFSGFMYASVASFMCQAWRRLDLIMVRWPSPWIAITLGASIYLNFFTNRLGFDLRWWITAGVVIAWWRTWVTYTTNGPRRRMPMVMSFFNIAFFVWLAENIATFLGAWAYPHQRDGWHPVHLAKLSSWSLLVIVSLIIVAELKRMKIRRHGLTHDVAANTLRLISPG